MGRLAALDRLRMHQAEAFSGEPQTVIVVGAAGYGKTAFLSRIEQQLDAWRCCSLSCDEAESRLPFDLVDRLVRRLSAGPEGWSTHGSADRPTDPFVVGSRLVQLLGDAPGSAPLAIMIDDGGYADSASLQALGFAVRRLVSERVLVVLSARPESLGRLPAGLLKFARDRDRLIELPGFDPAETRRLVAELGGGTISLRAAQRLVEHTAGSPLHLRALVAELSPADLASTTGSLPAPRSFAALVNEAAGRCSDAARRLASAAAVLGPSSALSTVARVAEVPRPLVALEEADRARLVTAAARDGGWIVGFPHPLVRSAIYDSLGPATRESLHRRAARELPADQALDHRVAAAQSPDPELGEILRSEATREVAAGRPARAADRLLAAVRLCAEGPDRQRLLAEAVDRLLEAGEVGEAVGHAAQLATAPPTPERLLVEAKLAWLTGNPAAEELARRVWLDAAGSRAGAGAAALVAQVRVLADDGPGATEWARRALSCLDISPQSALSARMNLATGLIISGRPEHAMDVVGEEVSWPSPAEAGPARWLRGEIRLWMDDPVRAYEDLRARPGEVVTDVVSPYGLMRLGFLSQAEYRTGRWNEALLHAEQAVSLVTDTDQRWLVGFAHSMAVYVLAGRGLWAAATHHVEAAREAGRQLGDQASTDFATNAAVHLAHARGEAELVLTLAEPMRARRSIGVHDPAAFGWRRCYAAALICLKRYPEAERWLADLAGDCNRRSLHIAAAEVAALQGELEGARRRTEAACRAFERAQSLDPDGVEPLTRARIDAAYGRFLRRSGERRAATSQLVRARDVFVRLDARPDLDRCTAELVANGVAVDAPASRVDARLTPQERAVARLVCGGRSNREVAGELVLSVKTVSYHLQNVYLKVGVNSRTQLVAALGPTER